MSISLISHIESLQRDNLEKDLTITSLNTKILSLHETNSHLQAKITSLTQETQLQDQELSKLLQDSSQKSAQILSLETQNNALHSTVLNLQKQIEVYSTSQLVHDSSELNNLKMLFCDLESKHLKTLESFLQHEKNYQLKIQELTASNTQKLLKKRDNWLNALPKLDQLPIKKIFSNIPELSPLTKKDSDPVSSVLSDIEKLLGWKIQYSEDQLIFSALNKSILIKKQQYSNQTYYNLEVSPDSLPLITTPEFNTLLFSDKNFPLFFASVLKLNS